MLRYIFICVLIFVMPMAHALELEQVLILGEPAKENKAPVRCVGWLNNDQIILERNGSIECYDLKKQKTVWQFTQKYTAEQTIIGDQQLYTLDDKNVLRVYNASHGKLVKTIDEAQLKKIFKRDGFLIGEIVWLAQYKALYVPLTLFEAEEGSDEVAVILNVKTLRLIKTIKAHDFLRFIRATRTGQHVITVTMDEVIRIWSISRSKVISKLGKGREDKTIIIDAPFVSHARFDDKNTLVFCVDNSWDKGNLFVFDTKKQKVINSFSSLNGHGEMDVDFMNKRIAITGTSKNLSLISFDGKLLAENQNAAQGRIHFNAFSPNHRLIMIDSSDGTLRVFEIK